MSMADYDNELEIMEQGMKEHNLVDYIYDNFKNITADSIFYFIEKTTKRLFSESYVCDDWGIPGNTAKNADTGEYFILDKGRQWKSVSYLFALKGLVDFNNEKEKVSLLKHLSGLMGVG